jgi:glycosyltransferase involved in cell wall biosynthesis
MMCSVSRPGDGPFGAAPRRAVARGRHLAGRLVVGTVGTLPFFERWLEVSRWRSTLALRREEDRLVAALARELGPLPAADVATIVPTHRRPEMLTAAVASALAQTVTDHRIVVVDDGAGITARLPEDERLTVVNLPHNVGTAGVVRNVGIRLSRSRLLAFLDDDNTWEPDHLETALAAHAAGAELSYSALRRVDESGRTIDVLSEPFDRGAMRERSLVDTNVLVVRRGDDVAFSRVPRRRNDFPLEDWELVWRLSRTLRVAHVPVPTVRYLCHDGSNFSAWGAEPTDG